MQYAGDTHIHTAKTGSFAHFQKVFVKVNNIYIYTNVPALSLARVVILFT